MEMPVKHATATKRRYQFHSSCNPVPVTTIKSSPRCHRIRGCWSIGWQPTLDWITTWIKLGNLSSSTRRAAPECKSHIGSLFGIFFFHQGLVYKSTAYISKYVTFNMCSAGYRSALAAVGWHRPVEDCMRTREGCQVQVVK